MIGEVWGISQPETSQPQTRSSTEAFRRSLSWALLAYAHSLFYELRRDDAILFYEYRSLSRHKPPLTLFGLRLRDARLRAGIPQDKLGVAIGLDEATASARVSRYETGVHATPYVIAMQLAKVLGVPVAFFYCEDDELAAVIRGWHRLPKGERKRVRALAERDD